MAVLSLLKSEKSQTFINNGYNVISNCTKGIHYAITTHTGHRQLSAQRAGKQPEIGIQLIGEKGKTKLIPLLYSQLNKQHAFLAGRKEVFDVLATDVGRVCILYNLYIITCMCLLVHIHIITPNFFSFCRNIFYLKF